MKAMILRWLRYRLPILGVVMNFNKVCWRPRLRALINHVASVVVSGYWGVEYDVS